MSLARCTSCKTRPGVKLDWVYWAWVRADGERVSYLSKLCRSCFTGLVGKAYRDYSGVDALTCPSCGIETEDDRDTIWATAFPAYATQVDVEAPFCGPCAAMFRLLVLEAADPLEQVRGQDSGPSSIASGADILRDLGWTGPDAA
jgi:hypothetical protein